MAFARQWIQYKDDEEYKNMLKNAFDVVNSGLKIHYRSRDLKQLSDDLKRALLMLRVPVEA